MTEKRCPVCGKKLNVFVTISGHMKKYHPFRKR